MTQISFEIMKAAVLPGPGPGEQIFRMQGTVAGGGGGQHCCGGDGAQCLSLVVGICSVIASLAALLPCVFILVSSQALRITREAARQGVAQLQGDNKVSICCHSPDSTSTSPQLQLRLTLTSTKFVHRCVSLTKVNKGQQR